MKQLLLAFAFVTALSSRVHADGVPEPGLILYGKVRNAAAGNALVMQGILTLTVQQVGGPSVVVSTPVQALSPGQSFRARVPFEVLLGSAATLSAGTFKMPTSTLAFQITQATFTHPSIGTTNLPLAVLSATSFNLSGNFRGEVRLVDMTLSASNLNPFADSDGDGMSDGNELLAGTNPNDPNSKLTITSVWCPAQGIAHIEWSSVPTKRYSMLRASALGSTNFTMIASNLIATNATTAFIDTNATNSAGSFYRVQMNP